MPSPNWLSNLKWRVRVSKNIREIDSRNVAPKKHPLDAPLAISLTSFPARFDTLALTLRCLLSQTIRPDAVILWVAENDFPELPQDVLDLQLSGLDIQTCEDIKSYKKLIPCLLENPDRYIVTADDDVHYEADWLEKLVSSSMRNTGKIISCRSHRIEYDTDGKLLPYAEWKKNIGVATASGEIFATGVCGVLYPPHCLDPRVTDIETFMRLCPSTDDVWLYWMARLAGTEVHHLGPKRRIVEWPSSQTVSLRQKNYGSDPDNGNDRAIAAMIEHFGQPGQQK